MSHGGVVVSHGAVVSSLAKECGVVLPPAEELNAHVSHFMNAAEGNMLSEEEFLTVLFEIFGEVTDLLLCALSVLPLSELLYRNAL